MVKTAKPAKKLTRELRNGTIWASTITGLLLLLYDAKEVRHPMQTPMVKKIYPTASDQMLGSESLVEVSVPVRYIEIPSPAPSRVAPLMSMMKMRMMGRGTVR